MRPARASCGRKPLIIRYSAQAGSHEPREHDCERGVTPILRPAFSGRMFPAHAKRLTGTHSTAARACRYAAAAEFTMRSTEHPDHVLLIIEAITDAHRTPLDAERLESERCVKRFRRLVSRIHA